MHVRLHLLTIAAACLAASILVTATGCWWANYWGKPASELPEHGIFKFDFSIKGTSIEPPTTASSPEEQRVVDAVDPVLAKKDWLQAIKILSGELSQATDPDVAAKCYLLRGYARQRQGDPQGAVADWSKSIELRPGRVGPVLLRALSYLEQDNLGLALSDLNAAIQIEPANVMLYMLRASLYMKREEAQLALADLDRAIELAPNDAKSLATRAMVFAALEKYDKAADDVTASLALDPKNGQAYMLRSIAHRKLGREEQSKADFAKARELGFKG